MKKIYGIASGILLAIAGTQVSYAQPENTVPVNSFNTAYLMPVHRWECGIGQPLRYGLSQKIELNTYAFKFPLSPNAGIKINLGAASGFMLASEHVVNIPAPFLNFFSRKGIGGVLSPEFDFPFILTVTNNLLATRPIGDQTWLTFKAGWIVAVRSRLPDRQSTIDLPVFYPRMAHFYKGTSVRLSTLMKGKILPKLWYDEGFQLFYITRSYSNFFAENTGSLTWSAGKKIRLKAGYNLSYGQYPFGNHWQLWPAFDVIFGSRQPE